MASISTAGNGTRIVQVTTPAGRKTIRMGKMSLKDAQQVAGHVEHLNAAMVANTALPVTTAQWLGGISDKLHRRIAQAGLIHPRASEAPVTVLVVGEMFRAYIEWRTDMKPGTVLVIEQSKRHASTFFGEGRDAGTVNVAETKDFRRYLAGKYSSAYTVKMMRQTRTVWRDAVERNLIPENPFVGVKVGSTRNPERQQFIDHATSTPSSPRRSTRSGSC